jgi:hypothetical protein
MEKLFKLTGILLALSLLILPLVGCNSLPWESGTILSVKVDTPKDGSTITTSMMTVSGHVFGSESASAKVSINDADAPVKDGKFSTNVTLTEGINVITVVAKSGAAVPSKTVTVTYAPSMQPN